MGWDHFQFGLVSPSLVQIQEDHFKRIGSRRKGVSWMSILLRKIWTLHHKMWLHRNSFVHDGSKNLHQVEREAVEKAMRWEFMLGPDGLDASYNDFFQGSLRRLTEKDDVTKKLWLSTIWQTRDKYMEANGLPPHERDLAAATFLQRNRLRRKRTLGHGYYGSLPVNETCPHLPMSYLLI